MTNHVIEPNKDCDFVDFKNKKVQREAVEFIDISIRGSEKYRLGASFKNAKEAIAFFKVGVLETPPRAYTKYIFVGRNCENRVLFKFSKKSRAEIDRLMEERRVGRMFLHLVGVTFFRR